MHKKEIQALALRSCCLACFDSGFDLKQKNVMRYVLVALMITILGPMVDHMQQKPVKVLSNTNGQQLLAKAEDHGRAVRLAWLQAPCFLQEPCAEFAQSVLGSNVRRDDHASFEPRSRDMYGRLVGRLFVNGKDIGAQLVR